MAQKPKYQTFNDPLSNDKGGIATWFDDVISTMLFGNQDATSNIWRELSGENAQMREFQQQEYLQEKQWEYDNPVNQMKRFIAAGVNPALAAQGVSGGNQSAAAPTVASPSSAPAAGLQSSAGAVQGAVQTGMDVYEKARLTEVERKKRLADTVNILENAGLTKLNAQGMAISLEYLGPKERLNVATMIANLDNIKKSHDVMTKQIELYDMQIKEMDKQIELMTIQGDYTNALKLQTEKNTAVLEQQRLSLKWHNDVRDSLGVDLNLPAVANLLKFALEGNTKGYEIVGNVIYKGEFSANSARYDAEMLKGANSPVALFDRVKERLKSLGKTLYNKLDGKNEVTAQDVRNYVREMIDELLSAEDNGKLSDDDLQLLNTLKEVYTMSSDEILKWWQSH